MNTETTYTTTLANGLPVYAYRDPTGHVISMIPGFHTQYKDSLYFGLLDCANHLKGLKRRTRVGQYFGPTPVEVSLEQFAELGGQERDKCLQQLDRLASITLD